MVVVVALAQVAEMAELQFARILKHDAEVFHDGTYKYAYETENGINAHEEGIGGVRATGSATYTSPEGVPVQISYTADANGYQPTGSHIPQTPEYVLRALKYIESQPAWVDKFAAGSQKPTARAQFVKI